MIRKLGYWESVCADLHERYHGTGMIVVALGIRGNVGEGKVRRALEVLQDTHGVLQVCIRKVAGGYAFFRRRDPSLPFRCQIAGEGGWQGAVEDAANTPLEPERALWRSCWLPSGDGGCLILCFHHAIADGRSVNQFALRVMACFAKRPGDSEFPPAVQKLHPNMEQLFSPRYTWQAFQEARNHRRADGVPRCSLPHIQAAIRRVHRQVYAHCNATVLANRCRQEDTSVTAFLAAALESSCEHVLGVRRPKLSIPICLRAQCTESVGLDLGCFVAVVPIDFADPVAGTLWERSRRLRRRIHDNSQSYRCLPETFPELIAWAPSPREFSLGLGVTSSGVASTRCVFGQLELSYLFVNAVRLAGGLAVSLSARSVGDRCDMTFAHVTPLLPSQTMREILAGFAERVSRCVRGVRFEAIVAHRDSP